MEGPINIPRYTINQKVFIADYDNFMIFAGMIRRRIFDKEGQEFKYILEQKDGEGKSVEEANVFPSFDDAKAHMGEVVSETLSGVMALKNINCSDDKPLPKKSVVEKLKKVGIKHEHIIQKDRSVLILKSIKNTGEVNTCFFDIANFKIIRELEKKFRDAKTKEKKETIFNKLKNLGCIKKAYEETKCLGSKVEGRKDYRLGAVIRPVTYYADCSELHKRSNLQQKYYTLSK